MKLGKHTVEPNHLSKMKFGEAGAILDDELPIVKLLKADIVPNQFKKLQDMLC